MKRNDSNFPNYLSPGSDSSPRPRTRLPPESNFHQIFDQICPLEKHEPEDIKEEPIENNPENETAEVGYGNDEFENEEQIMGNDEVPIYCSMLTPESMVSEAEYLEEYEDELVEGALGEEPTGGLYNDEEINEETVYRSLPQELLSEYELEVLAYTAIASAREWETGYANDHGTHKFYEDPKTDVPSNITRDQNYNAYFEVQNLSGDDNLPTTSRHACELLSSLQATPWMHQPNYQHSAGDGTMPVGSTNLLKQQALIGEYQKLLMQTYYLTKPAK